jgi:hypothetical protein
MVEAIALPVDLIRKLKPEQVMQNLQNHVVALNVPDFSKSSGYLFHKGHKLDKSDETYRGIQLLQSHAPAGFELHLLVLDDAHITEDEAGLFLAKMVAGPGVKLTTPHESRVNLLARERGLLKIDLERLDQLNEVPGVAVFTLYNEMTVEPNTEVTGAKVTPLIYPKKYLSEIEEICRGNPVVDVKPFLPRKIAVLYRELLKPSVKTRFENSVQYKLGWLGAEILGVEQVHGDIAELAGRLRRFRQQGAELILHVGGHSSDPLDPVFGALREVGAKMERQGAPAHPGTLFWLAYWEETAIFGLASCGMFSRTTLGDLFLARFCAGERLTSRDIARMGHGGLFTRELAFRFPSYE